ncbi:RPM1-interacting protein 4-like isoform X1 [Iris pallida]|uniref:RPM1-interacting protein 4-like isoform X1 n=1 Tax=Iris pallida TaxID=29817 RepID=A0AAX6FIM4_IRIPA|nr:RPM1-interacting protein 4-like isoform X1 [Iris pallida]
MEQQAHAPDAPKPENDLHIPNASALNHDILTCGTATESPLHLHNERSTPVEPLKKERTNGGSDRSVEQSPIHPRNQAKASWERRASSEGTHGAAPGTPGRFKLRTGGRGDESPDKGPTVPKFGEWDENNPSSADGYTQLFNQVREEKQTGGAKVPIVTNDAMYLNSYNQGGSYKSSSCWCFNWCRK